MSRTVLRASFRSRAIALIFRFCTKYARRTFAIVSTVTIPLLTPGANHALGAGLPPGDGVKIGCRSPPEGGQNCTPLHTFNPIPTNGPLGEVIYLSRLRTQSGSPIMFHRVRAEDGLGGAV